MLKKSKACNGMQNRKRWENGDSCKSPGKWKSCSFYHPELVKERDKERV